MTALRESSNASGQSVDFFNRSSISPYQNSMMDPFSNVWSHEVPNKMPWAPSHQPTLPKEESSSVMQFTGGSSLSAEIIPPDPCTSRIAAQWEQLNLPSGIVSYPKLKRRNSSSEDEDVEIQPPTKLYISEEKFSAQFNQMKITNVASLPSTHNNEEKEEEEGEEVEFFDANISEEKQVGEGRLYVSDEVQKVLDQPTDLFGQIIKKEVEKASKAIILWQPPLGVLAPELALYHQSDEDDKQKSGEDTSIELDLTDTSPMDAEVINW